jgi:hypothetical protein
MNVYDTDTAEKTIHLGEEPTRLSNDWERHTFLAGRLRTLKINEGLTADSKKPPKIVTIENEFTRNVSTSFILLLNDLGV